MTTMTKVSPSSRAERVRHFFETHSQMSGEELFGHYTDDIHYRFANTPETVGQSALLESAKASHIDQILSTCFEVKSLWDMGDTIICQMEAVVTHRDGRILRLPCCDVIHLRGDLFCDFKVYIDPTPLSA